jgi:hypothetical protein
MITKWTLEPTRRRSTGGVTGYGAGALRVIMGIERLEQTPLTAEQDAGKELRATYLTRGSAKSFDDGLVAGDTPVMGG